jgi:hypothetical protein
LIELSCDVPGEQLLDAVDRVISDSLKNVLKITLRIDLVASATLDQGINDRGALATRVRSKEKIIFATDSYAGSVNDA